MQVYQAIVKGLESVGVDAAFGGNGENIASLAVALKHSGIRPIATRHEQAAAYMTRGYAMFTNKLGVCYASVGPGASRSLHRPGRGNVGFLRGIGDYRLHPDGVGGWRGRERHLRPQPNP